MIDCALVTLIGSSVMDNILLIYALYTVLMLSLVHVLHKQFVILMHYINNFEMKSYNVYKQNQNESIQIVAKMESHVDQQFLHQYLIMLDLKLLLFRHLFVLEIVVEQVL